jgi:hypothetical protein
MDTSATARKASTDKEKEEYRKTGRCFECGKQGHLACVCPSKKRKEQGFTNRRAKEEDEEGEETDPDLDDGHYLSPHDLATHAVTLTEKDRDAFVARLRELGAETGFQQA